MKVELLMLLLFLLVSEIAYSQKIFKNLNSTPIEWHERSLSYLKSSIQRFQDKEIKTSRDSFSYYRNIAAMYKNLGESADTVFKYVDLFLLYDKYMGCQHLVGHEKLMKESKNGMYYGKLDQQKYLKRLKLCKKYLIKQEQIVNLKIKSDSALDQNMISLIGKMIENDQKYRMEYDYKKQHPLDQQNQILLDSIFSNYGFPGKSRVSDIYTSDVVTIFLHTETEFQDKWIPLVITTHKRGELPSGEIQFILDRYHTRKFEKQFFGTQLLQNNDTKKMEPVEKYTRKEQKKILDSLGLSELLN